MEDLTAGFVTGRRRCRCRYLHIGWRLISGRAAGNTTPLLGTSAHRRKFPDQRQRSSPSPGSLRRRSGFGPTYSLDPVPMAVLLPHDGQVIFITSPVGSPPLKTMPGRTSPKPRLLEPKSPA